MSERAGGVPRSKGWSLADIWSRASIRAQLLCVIAPILLMIVAIFYWVIGSVSGIVLEKNERYVREMIALEAANLAEKYDEISRMIYVNGFDPDVQQLMVCQDAWENYALQQKLKNRFAYLKNQNEGILDYVFLGHSYNFTTKGGISLVERMCDTTQSRMAIEHSGALPYKQYESETGIPAIIFGAQIYRLSGATQKMEYLGFSAVIYRADSLLIGPGDQVQATSFFLVDEDGLVCAQRGPAGEALLGGALEALRASEEYQMAESEVPEIGMRLVSLTHKDQLFSGLRQIRTRFILVFVASALLILLVFFFAVRYISRPIGRLSLFMEEIQGARLEMFDKRLALRGSREMSAVARQFNSMLGQIGALTHSLFETNTRLYEARLEKKRAQLYALRAQINPHFLYNTLECVKGIAYEQHAPKVAEILNAMARIFRYSVKGADTVCLAEELNASKAYLAIQQARFESRFEVTYEFSERALKGLIPKMALQPIIENAICHGVEPSLSPVRLQVLGEVDGEGRLIVTVRDDGPGMEARRLAEVRRSLEDAQARADHASIGLQNIHRRIVLCYGAPYGVQVDSAPGAGATVVIWMPYLTEEEGGVGSCGAS